MTEKKMAPSGLFETRKSCMRNIGIVSTSCHIHCYCPVTDVQENEALKRTLACVEGLVS